MCSFQEINQELWVMSDGKPLCWNPGRNERAESGTIMAPLNLFNTVRLANETAFSSRVNGI